MKKIVVVLLAFIFSCMTLLTVSADESASLLNDMADIFTDEEEAVLIAKQDELADVYSVKVAVVTVDSLGDMDFEEFSNEYCSENFGYDYNGLILTLNMETNTFYSLAFGELSQFVGDDEYTYVDDAFIEALSYDESTYADGVAGFLDACDFLLFDIEFGSDEAEDPVTDVVDVTDDSKEEPEISYALPLLIDNADLLSDSEETELNEKLTEASKRLNCDIVILTEAEIDDDAESYADDYFDYNGYGKGNDRDGILLLVSMDPRVWHVSGSGICNSEYISTEALEYISENVEDDLKAEEYADCFNTYLERSDDVITDARDGKEFKEPFDIVMSLGISLAIGFIVAFIVTGVMKSDLKSVRSHNMASNYLKEDSLVITNARDMFLYRQITRTKKESNKSSGSHTSSSGRSHSGTGGSF